MNERHSSHDKLTPTLLPSSQKLSVVWQPVLLITMSYEPSWCPFPCASKWLQKEQAIEFWPEP